MSDASPSPMFMFDNSDPAMSRAVELARASFKFFWREIAWERRRIVPALSLAAVKMPFSDGPGAKPPKGMPAVEQMWVGDIDFDGEEVSGTLLNSPNGLKSVKAGDQVSRPLGEISDWMYALGDVVYGAFTVNLIRHRMNPKERAAHDKAWGLNFGDPTKIAVAPNGPSTPDADYAEHPMSEAMADSLREHLAANPSFVHEKSDGRWTILHHQALAGSLATVRVLLDAGADVNALTDHGMTALQLAQALGWNRVAELLASRGAR